MRCARKKCNKLVRAIIAEPNNKLLQTPQKAIWNILKKDSNGFIQNYGCDTVSSPANLYFVLNEHHLIILQLTFRIAATPKEKPSRISFITFKSFK